MRVLMLSKACLVGLYQRKLELIAAQPSLSAFKVLVPPSWKDERGEMPLERAYTQGYELAVTPIRFNGHFHWHYYPQLAAEVAHFRPDILHIDEEPYNLATWLALYIARRAGVKTLFFSWQNILRHYPPPFAWGEKWVLNRIDYALMGTESAAEIWRQKGYHKPSAIVPQFGVDPDQFPPKDLNHPAETLTIAYVGRLVAEKGVDLLLTALAALPAHLKWRLLIIGGGPEEKALNNQANSLNLTSKVQFVGQVPSLEMPRYFPQMDILVLPSRTLLNWKEQFGRVLIEAMVSRVVVVGSDSGAIPDVIGEGGLIFPEDDAEQLTHRLQNLLENRDFRHELAERGRQRVLAHFTQAQVAEQTVHVYEQMLAAGRG